MKRLKLTQGKYAIVDNSDFELLNQFKWFSNYKKKDKKKIYASIKINGKHISMHRYLLKPPSDLQIDHINGDGLDNRRSNLRLCNQYQNNANCMKTNKKTGLKGVEEVSNRPGNFCVRIRVYGKRLYLGNFHSKIEAAKAYNEAALKYFGEFALLNKI